MDGIAHPLEIRLTEQFGHGWGRNGRRLWYKHGMAAFFVGAGIRMYQALQLKQPEGVHIPGERTVYRVMEEIGLNHRPKRKPNGITKADKEARKSDDLIKRDFTAEKPLEKCVTDMTEIKASDGKLYVSAIFDCYDLAVLGLAMDTNMKATLCEKTLDNAYRAFLERRAFRF